MPVRMIATRRHFVKSNNRDVNIGENFEVESEDEAKRLERRRKAVRNISPVAEMIPAPKAVMPKAMKEEVPAQPVRPERRQDSTVSAMTTDDAAGLVGERRRYTRRDMRSED